jgi:hypothetical protein
MREERMQETRKHLESEADRLGVPWTHATTDAELQALVKSRLQGGQTMANGAPETNQCHGLFWDYPRAKECKQCSGHQSCFQKFVETTFPGVAAQLGEAASLADLAKALDVSEEAVLLAKNQQRQAQPPQLLQPPPVDTVPEPEQAVPDSEPEPQQPDEGLDFSDADELEDELAAQPEESEVIQKALDPELEPEYEPEPPLENENVAVKKAPRKKKAAKKASKKAAKKATTKTTKAPRKKKAAKAPPPVTSEAQNPTPAGSAKTATGSARTKARAKNAPRAKAQAGQVKSGDGKKQSGPVADPWGPQTWPARWEKERQNKWIGLLRPGMKLKKKYKGEIHEVRVLKRYYRYNDQTYPTLYSVVKEITGTKLSPRQLDKEGQRPEGSRQLCAWSAPRFFALPVLFTRP